MSQFSEETPAGGTVDSNPDYWLEYSNLQKVKHDVIRWYLGGWFPKLTLGQWGSKRVLYVDTNAGRGKHLQGQLGSPLVALDSFLNHDFRDRILASSEVFFYFIERDKSNVNSLQQELKAREPLPKRIGVEAIAGDCFKVLEGVVASLKKEGKSLAPSFIFCDPYGFKVPGRTLRELMTFPRVELFVNVIWRELDMAIRQGDKPGMAALLDSIFDGPEWRAAIMSADHDQRAEQCVTLIRKKTGARWATTIRMLGENRATRYFLLHLTNSDDGRDLMKETVWKACPEGGYYARKSDYPAQQMLIMPEPDLRPLREWTLARLRERPHRWLQLHEMIRPTMWLGKHLNEVVRDLRKEKKVEDFDYRGKKHFSPSNNPNLKLREAA
ncbi:MAG: three-Cys-motif partner protein TcmP [Elusimicrobia bacterium]|nr:three-Cys-motif partner protein TcmP [Elusimicrobiota bacterium]